MFTTIHKHYSLNEWINFAAENPDVVPNLAVSSGTSANDFTKLCAILEKIPELKYICIDVANGYSETFVDFVKKVRATFDKKTIMAGNVVTGEMVEELILAGADVIKVIRLATNKQR